MKMLLKYPLYFSFISLISLAFSTPASAQTIVCLETTMGDICMELLDTDAPVTAQNFLAYVDQGSYRNSFFHLSEKDGPVYLQGGRYADTGAGTLEGLLEIFRRPPISNESSVSNTRGTVAMVPDDPANPDSTTSQFLINVTDNPSLDSVNGGYTVFARLIGDGMAVADAIASLPLAALDNDTLSRVPVIGQEVPIINSPRVNISDAYVYDGDITDFEPGNGGTDSGTDGGTDGGTDTGTDGGTDGGTDTPTPGEGQTLYEDAVCVDTNVGEFCMELFPDKAPITVANFLKYINDGRYDDTIIHRTVPNFVIQGGGYSSNPLGAEVPKYAAITNEFSLSNLRGTVAMARIGGQINSATSEWFVNLVNNTALDNVDEGFTVFGEIISGMSVVDQIGALPRINLSNSLGGAFGELPRSRPIGAEGVVAEDLVLVHRIYVTDVIVDDAANDGSGSDPGTTPDDGVKTTTTYYAATRQFALPVRVGENLYRLILNQDPEASGLVFAVDTTRIVALNDSGQDAGTMDLANGTFVIPSIKVGDKVFTDVSFDLIEYSTLTFKLKSYTRP